MSDDELICSENQRRLEAGFDEPIMFDRLEDTFYPGSIVDTSTIPTGAYERVNADRVPMNLLIDPKGMSIDGSTQYLVEDPTRANIRDARITLEDRLDPAAGEGFANMDYSEEVMYSEEMSRTFVGAHYDGITSEFEGSFEYESETESYEALVRLQQVYYSVDVDLETPGAFFMDGRTPEPTSAVVDRVNYGRIVLFSIRSDRSASELETSVEAAFDTGVNEGSVDVEHDQEELLRESEIHATVLGGGADTGGRAVTANSIADVDDIINEGSSYGPDHPGAPISYHMTYLIDGSDAGIQTATDYTVRSCDRKATTYEAYDFELVNHYEGTTGSRRDDDPVAGYIEVHGEVVVERGDSGFGGVVYPDESEGQETVYLEGDDVLEDEHDADSRIWIRPVDEEISVDRPDEENMVDGRYEGVRELEATATVDFPGSAETIDYSDSALSVVGNLRVRGDRAGEHATLIPLEDITTDSEDPHRLRFTGHEDQPMDLEFRTRPVLD